MGPSRVQKPAAAENAPPVPGDAPATGWRGQLQRSLQGEGFDAAKARLAPQAMPPPVLEPNAAAPSKHERVRKPSGRG